MPGVNVGTGFVEIRPDLSGFGRQLRSEVTRDIGSAGKEASASLKSSLQGAVRGALAGVAAFKITGFLSGAIEAASDLNEELSKSNAVFKSAAAGVEQWAKEAADNLGLSERAAFEAASTFGNMFVQLGFGADRAAAMSKSIVELGVDFRSFTNADIGDVLAAQSAAFRGEYDALQRFLPLISAATVQQRALALTGKRSVDELTAQDRALAVNALMFEGAGDAAGDFRRTQESLANQQQKTTAAMENQNASIGKSLIPLQKEWSKILREEVIPAFTDLFSTEGSATSWAATIQNTVGDLVGWLFGSVQQTLRLMANVFDKLPTHFGEGIAQDLRDAADAGDGFRDKMHASKAEMQEWARASGSADAAQADLAGSTRDATDAARQAVAGGKSAAETARDQAKASRDAAAAERDLGDARDDLAKLLRTGAVDEEKVADARERLADATRTVDHAQRSLAKSQKEYDQALAAARILGTDTANDDLAAAADALADAKDGAAEATARQKDAEKDLKAAQAGDPEYQDKLADARDRVADAQDRVADTAAKVAANVPAMTGAVNEATAAIKALNGEAAAAAQNLGFITGGLLGISFGPSGPRPAPAPTPAFTLPAFGVPGPAPGPLLGPPAPSTATSSTKNVTVNNYFNERPPDPAYLGKMIAWQL